VRYKQLFDQGLMHCSLTLHPSWAELNIAANLDRLRLSRARLPCCLARLRRSQLL